MTAKAKVAVLCVDDEESVLEGLSLHLERRYRLQTATGGSAGLEVLRASPEVAVIISDMRMPGMDGAAFLARARQQTPDAVRLLLTGQTDIDSAISAVNDGQIFRFLTKPCAPKALLGAVEAAVEQHLLITSQRELLEQTLHGCIKALTDILALTNPVAFGRAHRIKLLVSELAAQLQLPDRWQVEVAAMLSQLAHVTLSSETAERLYFGRSLSSEEQRQVDHLPVVTEQLLVNIPRIEGVREILSFYLKPVRAECLPVGSAAASQVLRAAVDFDARESHGTPVHQVLDAMRARPDRYAPHVLEALTVVRGQALSEAVREVSPGELLVGMLLAEDVFLPTGVLLVARGHEITPRFMERIRNLPPGTLKKKLQVTSRTPLSR